MKKFSKKEIKNIFSDIKNGQTYCGIYNGHGIGNIWINEDYIMYRYYGESAVKATMENLKWLLETIFDSCETVTPSVWSDYHINYIPIDQQYIGVDMSRMHPNTFGV